MASTPNLNPPVSSAAVHAAIFQAKAPRRGENPDPERGRQRAKCVPARTETQFRGALNRGLTIEVTREPAEQIGVMGEDGGSVEEITTARSELHDPEWRRTMAEKSSWQRGEDYRAKVSGEPIDEIQRGVAHDEERDTAEAENRAGLPAGAAVSQSERDGAWWLEALRWGLDPAIVRARLEEGRAEDPPHPEYDARRRVERALAALTREIPAQEIER